MRKLTSAVAAIALLGGVSAAYATVTGGTIKSLNLSKDRVTLDSGTTYSFPKSVKLSGLKVGEKVEVNYSYNHGKFDASSIKRTDDMHINAMQTKNEPRD